MLLWPNWKGTTLRTWDCAGSSPVRSANFVQRVVQLGRTPALGAGGKPQGNRGFKSHPSDQLMSPWCNWLTHQVFILKSSGSSPDGDTIF